MSKIEPALLELGYRIVALSPDRPDNLRKSAEKLGLGYRLLSDSSMRAGRAYGLAYRVDDDTLGQLRGFGIDIEKASGQDHRQLPVPAALVVDAEGIVRFRFYDPDHTVRVDPDALLAAAREAVPAETTEASEQP